MNKIAILLGSETDRPIVESSLPYFEYFNMNVEIFIKSAHRNPEDVSDFSKNARSNGYSIIIGAAGMAAHLAGAIKSNTTLPVIGIPLPGGMMDGLDSLLSTVNMPKGVPVATVSMGKAGAINAGLAAAAILGIKHSEIRKKLISFRASQT